MKIALEYKGYLQEGVCAIGLDAIAKLDLSAQTMHFDSSSALDPILECGLGPKYRLWDMEIPDWFLAGIERGKVDGRWHGYESALDCAVDIALWGLTPREGWASKLRPLIARRGKFAKSLQVFFSERGFLTDKQVLHI